MQQGKAIIVSAPSGAGKTTIVHHLLGRPLNLAFSVSACSRQKRPNETDGVDYYFLSAEAFRKKIAADEFVEWEEVYPNHFYGTLKSEISRIWNSGQHVIFDVDVVGGLNLKKAFGKKALSVFIEPPSVQVLENRLRQRESETEEMLQKRVGKAQKELALRDQFDVVIVNDVLTTALHETESVVKSFLNT